MLNIYNLVIAGYDVASFKWWLGIIVGIVCLLIAGGLIALFVIKKKFKKHAPWFIPVVSLITIVAVLGSSVLPVIGEQLMVTIFGSPVTVYDTETSIAAAAEAAKNVITIEEEGIVLLKNENNALPLNKEENNKVNIFGSCAFGMMYGNGGSGTFATNWSNGTVERRATRFNTAMLDEGFEYNQLLYNVVANNFKSKGKYTAEEVANNFQINTGVNTYGYAEIVSTCIPYEYEVPAAKYTDSSLPGLNGKTLLDEAKEYSDVAIYAISRYGTESQDMKESEMKIKTEERNMITMLEENFEKVIILLNVPVSIEADFLNEEGIDAALFVGHPGLTGTVAIAEVLSGKVNPSGHLVDTWAYNEKSAPSWQSFGNDTVLTYSSGRSGKPFVEFVEGIYVGYRYYVTRGMTDPDYKYDEEVQYSFGHGLSYTTFDQWIQNYKIDLNEQKVEISVGVKNTGDVAGKDVIQIYNHAPYYAGGIEKSYYSLQEFAKTSLLNPGDEKYYLIEFNFRDMASWSTSNGMYVSEHGDYEISLRKNVWEIEDEVKGKVNTFKISLAQDIEYPYSYQTGAEYANIFQDVEHGPRDEAITYLSRNDWTGTWTNKDDIDRNAKAELLEGGKDLGQWSFDDNQIEGDYPTLDAKNGTTLRDLKDADFDDPMWEDLLDNLTLSEMQNLVDNGGFQTAAVNSISKIASKDYDGPAAAFHSGTGHPSEVILACTWNRAVAELMGNSVGFEGAARGITGWYAPGINIHRNPYGGRNFEYYSEDPLISGQIAGYTSKGLAKYGVYAYAKHFALNEQEKNREELYVWCSEQALREIYARGFEHYVNLGGLGLMTSFNKVGSYWAGASKALCTTLLREEWGFHGVVVTDYVYSSTMGANIGLRAQNDLWLLKNSTQGTAQVISKTPNDGAKLLRRACKNILYACAHSNNVWDEDDYKAVGIEEVIKATDRS